MIKYVTQLPQSVAPTQFKAFQIPTEPKSSLFKTNSFLSMASVVGFNALWLLCVVLLIVAFFLAARRRRLANRAEAQRNENPTFIRHNGQEVRIHMQTIAVPQDSQSLPSNNEIRPPPPAFDPEEQPPPPSYQDFRKDVQLQLPAH